MFENVLRTVSLASLVCALAGSAWASSWSHEGRRHHHEESQQEWPEQGQPQPEAPRPERPQRPQRPSEEWPQERPEEPTPGATASDCTYGPLTCISGYVWRDAKDGDGVCVTPDRRDQAHRDNAMADQRRASGGAYGPDTCKSGFVWREAFEGDHVCVTPDVRDQAVQDNAVAQSRIACHPD
jgi:hypothetical protein